MNVDHLIIDDMRMPTGDMWIGKAVHVVKTSADAIAWFEANRTHALLTVSFDHDLGLLPDGSDDTAVVVARYLEERAATGNPQPIEHVYVHTSNHTNGGGAWEIKSALSRDYRVDVVNSNQLGLTYPGWKKYDEGEWNQDRLWDCIRPGRAWLP